MFRSAGVRSILSVPGSSARFLDKAAGIPADVIAYDLHTSVAPGEKSRARWQVAEALATLDKRGRLAVVRPNSLDSGLLEADLDAVVTAGLDAVHLPNADSADVLRTVDAYLTYLERTRGLPAGSVALLAWIESAEAVAEVQSICAASPRLVGISFGAIDYVASLRTSHTYKAYEIAYARGCVVNAARARGLVAVDSAEPDVTDVDFFEVQAALARQLGYQGKLCLHPGQVEVANRVFASAGRGPAPDEGADVEGPDAEGTDAEGTDAEGTVAANEAGVEDGHNDVEGGRLSWQSA